MSVDRLLDAVRTGYQRVRPEQADELRRSGALLVDIRPHANRAAEGEIPGAVVIERIHLEWRLDPAGEHRIGGFDAETPVVVFCNEGYASSFAVRDLLALGLSRATDLDGGYRAWHTAGLDTQPGGSAAVP
jgi:rhodanese-related sulfurtransferase